MPSSYDPDGDFDRQVKLHHEEKKTLIAKSITRKASQEHFEDACGKKLSKPDTCVFNWYTWVRWSPFMEPHMGYVLLHFETQSDCERALEELQDFEFHNRKIKVIKFAPLTPTGDPPRLEPQFAGTFKGTTDSDKNSRSIVAYEDE